MSREDAQAFIERMRRDEAFMNDVIAIEDVEKKIAFINRHGYSFTSSELSEVQHGLLHERYCQNDVISTISNRRKLD